MFQHPTNNRLAQHFVLSGLTRTQHFISPALKEEFDYSGGGGEGAGGVKEAGGDEDDEGVEEDGGGDEDGPAPASYSHHVIENNFDQDPSISVWSITASRATIFINTMINHPTTLG